MPYVFDTSGLMDAWVRYYPPDSFPRLWEHIDELIAAGNACAPEEVLEELAAQDDELHKWVKARKADFIVPTSTAIMLEVRSILERHPNLTKAGTGRNKADPFVIALARLREWPLVTGERGGSTTKPRIPFVCDDLDVGHLTVLELIRTEAWRF